MPPRQSHKTLMLNLQIQNKNTFAKIQISITKPVKQNMKTCDIFANKMCHTKFANKFQALYHKTFHIPIYNR